MLENISERNQFFKIKLFHNKLSTTRSQKRRNDQQKGDRNVSEGFVSPIVMKTPCSSNQDVEVAGPSRPKSPRIENSLLENLRASLKEEITSEIKNFLIESQKEMLELLKPKARENIRDNFDEETENETRNFYTPTKSVRKNSTQNDPNISRNTQFRRCHGQLCKNRVNSILIYFSTPIEPAINITVQSSCLP